MPTAPYPQLLPPRISEREFGWVPPGAGLAPFASYLRSRKPSEVAEQCSGKVLSVKLSLQGSSKVVGQPGAPELGDQSPAAAAGSDSRLD
ncbi:unnamed protein product [Rangifer tarandus platyrhynchus]|uniref:Uncharacterized protein n=2 Tax=Rangifer tarandus platyrhynchus TaxID=3082113 RepID=A0ABN8YVJ2_RANTA|nr:unnamed protein product [Rangifer tarandus platyrhynchus]CAI9703041.1 unnamed protein product [Rangifer tarandus platyrhynchus]